MATGETTAGTETATLDDWESIRYVFYVTAGWLLMTATAVVLLMTVVPSLI